MRRTGVARHLANLALFGGALLLVLLVVELVLRRFGLASPVLYRLDPVVGYEPRPGQASSRLGVTVHINDAGLRDDEPLAAIMRSPGRVLVVGNSVTYGSSLVSQDELFTEVAEEDLRPRWPGIKVLNGGVAGYSVSQIARRAPRLMRSTEPQWLVLYVIREDFNRAPVRYPHLDSDHEPQRRPPLALMPFVRLSLGFVAGRYRVLDRWPTLKAVWPSAPPSRVPAYDQSRLADLHLEALAGMLRDWESTGRSRSRVLAFVSPTQQEVAERRERPNADLIARLDSLGIRAHDLQPDFVEAMTHNGRSAADYYHDNIHYRPAGNAVAGRVLASYLTSALAADSITSGAHRMSPAPRPN